MSRVLFLALGANLPLVSDSSASGIISYWFMVECLFGTSSSCPFIFYNRFFYSILMWLLMRLLKSAILMGSLSSFCVGIDWMMNLFVGLEVDCCLSWLSLRWIIWNFLSFLSNKVAIVGITLFVARCKHGLKNLSRLISTRILLDKIKWLFLLTTWNLSHSFSILVSS